jgi:chromosomal replication initiation ATPase DnaA
MVKEEQAFLLITAQDPPAHWQISLKDLASRLRAIPTAQLHAPDEALLKAVYIKLFADRQMSVETGVVDYLMQHTTRTLVAAQKIVQQLDQLSLEKGRKITKLLANEVISNEQHPPA